MQSFISEYCPHCGAEVEWRAGLFARNTVGPEVETCSQCGKGYTTGRKEWARMSAAEHRDFYRRTALRCLAAFAFWVMGVMLAAFIITGAIFQKANPAAMQISLLIGLVGGFLLAARVFQLARAKIKQSLDREPFKPYPN